MFLRLFENKFGASLAEKVSDQHAAGAIDKSIDGHGILTLYFDCANRARQAGGTKFTVIEPERFDCIAELRTSLREHQFENLIRLCFDIVRWSGVSS